ncbi:MAG TPA: bifunctional UDP-sugar hydrolase/5'-nucleotidase [Kofleriaceae bacterium]|jgi:2',3'-cyclic-nucleotide 2'-phosphodiesterase (5'-nucleotidase family)
MNRTGALGFVAALAFSAASLGACTVTQDQPNLVGQDIRLTVIHTSDIHSRLFPYNMIPNSFDAADGLQVAPYGGIAKIATLVKRFRAGSNRSIWLDSGDAFQGAPVFNLFKGEAEMRALSLAGLDAAAVGNHEFDLGSRNLYDQISNWATYPILAANYAWDDPPAAAVGADGRSLRDVVPPYEVFDVKGLKIAVIGMGNTSTITSIYEGGNNIGFRPIADEDALSKYVGLLRPSVDLIVVVSHLGLDEDEGLTAAQAPDENQSAFSQKTLQGVDLILGGHLHIVTNPPKIIPNDDQGHRTVLVHSGAFAKFVGKLDLVVHVGTNNGDPATRSRITSFTYDNVPVDSKLCGTAPCINDDPDIANLMWPYSVKINQEIDLNGVFAYVNSANEKILRADASGGDSQLGNMVARSMQLTQGVEAEFAVTNSLGIRADFEHGPLNIEQMFNVFPFENSITVMYLSGAEIQEMFDFVSRRSADRGCRTQAQVSGVAFDMVCNGTCPDFAGQPEHACAKNIAIGDSCRGFDATGKPLSDGPIDNSRCPKLVSAGLYRVAVNDYIAAGGSGFDVLKRNTSKQDTGISLRDGLRVFLRQRQLCAEGTLDETVTPSVDVTKTYGAISCLDETIEQHDGRIRPVFE